MKTNRRFLLAASLVLAITFTLSCSDDKDDGSPPAGGGDIGPCTGDPVTIGTQVWQKCNLNVEPVTGNSACYGNDPSNCAKYGRLYDWAAAMTACPSGWHLPSNADWDVLMKHVNPNCADNSYCVGAGTKLKARSGWNDYEGKSGNGTDDYGFAALPGGNGLSGGGFSGAGYYGNWWSATEDGAYNAYYRRMHYYNENVYWSYYDKSGLGSVRCLQD